MKGAVAATKQARGMVEAVETKKANEGDGVGPHSQL